MAVLTVPMTGLSVPLSAVISALMAVLSVPLAVLHVPLTAVLAAPMTALSALWLCFVFL